MEAMELGQKVEPTSFTEYFKSMEAMEVEPTSFTEYFKSPGHVNNLKPVWPDVDAALQNHGISGTLNLDEGCITVSTTTRTTDPDVIHRARDCIFLLCKTIVPPCKAIRVLNGELHYDYIKFGYQEDGLAAIHGIKKERLAKRQKRLGESVKVLAHAVGCSFFVDGDSATSVGVTLGLVMVFRTIVKRCIVGNIDPASIAKGINKRVLEGKMARQLDALHI